MPLQPFDWHDTWSRLRPGRLIAESPSRLTCVSDDRLRPRDHARRSRPAHTFAHLLPGALRDSSNLDASSANGSGKGKAPSAVRSTRSDGTSTTPRVSPTNYVTRHRAAPRIVLVDDSATAVVRDLGAGTDGAHPTGPLLRPIHHRPSCSTTAIPSHWNSSVAACAQGLRRPRCPGDRTERYNLLNAWLAVLPGNGAYNVRFDAPAQHQLRGPRRCCFAQDAGARDATRIWTAKRSPCSTDHASRRLSPSTSTSRTIGHTLVLGATVEREVVLAQLPDRAPATVSARAH